MGDNNADAHDDIAADKDAAPVAADETPDSAETPADDTSVAETDSGANPAGSGGVWRAVAAVALIVAVGALGLSGWLLLRPAGAPQPAASPTEQQVTDAKARACTAFTTVRAALAVRNNADPGTDPGAAVAELVAINARAAFNAAAPYLYAHLDEATPQPLAEAIGKFAEQAGEVGMTALVGVGADNADQAAQLAGLDTLTRQIADLCQ